MVNRWRVTHNGEYWDFSSYFEYMESVAGNLPLPMRSYACDEASYALHGEKTLHDARLLSLSVNQSHDAKNPQTDIVLRLMAQNFRDEICLEYKGVLSYHFKSPAPGKCSHADVLVHEFALINEGLFGHRIVLDHGGEIQIQFERFSHKRNSTIGQAQAGFQPTSDVGNVFTDT